MSSRLGCMVYLRKTKIGFDCDYASNFLKVRTFPLMPSLLNRPV